MKGDSNSGGGKSTSCPTGRCRRTSSPLTRAITPLNSPAVRQVDQRIESENATLDWPHLKRTVLLGLAVGLIFGSLNLLMTLLSPLAEDTRAAVIVE